MKLRTKAFITAALSLAIIQGNAYGQNATLTEMQNNVLANSGLTRAEGKLYYRVMMHCKKRGFPENNIWNRCMHPTYVANNYKMPSSLIGAATFAAIEKCIYLTNDTEMLQCTLGGL